MLRHLIVTLLAISSLSFATTQVKPSENDQPYIYYYSNIENAIVIEHADGTDSRLLGAGLMPPRHMRIIDFSWSASGKWVAWRSGANGEQLPEATPNLWILSSDGSKRLTLLDNLGDYFYALKWSPNQDYLMVIFAKNTTFSYVIIDPKTDKIVARTDYQGWPVVYQESRHTADWLDRGDTITYQIQIDKVQLVGQLSIDNKTTTRVFQEFNHSSFMFQKGRIFWKEYNFSNGKVELKIEDLNNEKVVTLLSGVNTQNKFQLIWSPTFDHALLIEQECPSQSQCPFGSTTRVSLVNWADSTVTYIGSDFYPQGFYTDTTWSADANFILLRDRDQQAFVFDLLSFRMLPVEKGDSITFWQWLIPDKAALFVVNSNSRASYFLFDIPTGKTQALTFPSPATSNFIPMDGPPQFIVSSEEGRYFSVRQQSESGATYSIYDRLNKKKLAWFSHSLGGRGGPFAENLWRFNDEWYMTSQNIAFAGGGVGPDAVIVLNVEGTIRRELSFCIWFPECAGFVPERVLPYLAKGNTTSVIQQPIATLYLPHMTDFAWSPDSTRLVSYRRTDDKPILQIWDVISNQPRLTKEITIKPIESNQSDYIGPYLTWNRDGKSVTLIWGTSFSMWNIDTGSLISSGEYTGKLSPNQQYRWKKTDDIVTILDAKTNRELSHFTFQDPIADIPFWSSDGSSLFSNVKNDAVLVWESRSNTLTKLPNPSGYMVNYLAANEHYVVAGNQYTIAHVWDITTQKQLKDLNFYPTAARFTPDGKYLAAATNDQITIWDTADFK